MDTVSIMYKYILSIPFVNIIVVMFDISAIINTFIHEPYSIHSKNEIITQYFRHSHWMCFT